MESNHDQAGIRIRNDDDIEHSSLSVELTNVVVTNELNEDTGEKMSLLGSHHTNNISTSVLQHADNHGMSPGSASNSQVAFNIIISFVGAGMLGIPYAFKQSGWVLGMFALAMTSTANVYAMLLLVKVRQQLELEGHLGIQSYGDVGRIVMGPTGEKVVNVCVIISQVGFSTAYLIFVAANLYSIAEIPVMYACLGCIPVLALLVQARDMRTLSPFSLVADIACFAGLSAVLFQDFKSYSSSQHEVKNFDSSNLLYVVSISIYSLEGVSMILPLESSCRKPQDFPLLFKSVLFGLTLFMILFGSAGYLAFAEHTKAPITLNLTGSSWATFVKLALCLALYLTYPLMMFPVHGVLERHCGELAEHAGFRVTFRIFLVVMTAIIAYGIPDFGKFLALAGSSILTILGFIFPCYFHLIVYDMKNLKWWEILLDILLIAFGIVFGALGTYDSFCNLFIHQEASMALELNGNKT